MSGFGTPHPQTDGGLEPTRTPPTYPDHNFLPRRPCTRLSKSPGNDPRSVVSSGLCGRRETTALRDALGRVIAWRQAGVTVIVEDGTTGCIKKKPHVYFNMVKVTRKKSKTADILH